MKKRYGLLIFIVAIGCFLLAGTLLVKNRQNAANQAKQIVVKDNAGTNVDTDLIKLRVYAASHMKVNVKFVLTGGYDRAVAAAKAESAKTSDTYTAAQAACDKQGVDSISQSQCVAAYIAANPSTVAEPKLPDVADYTYHFIGPVWSFDLAGIIFIISGLLAIFAIASVIHRAVTK